VRIRARSKHMNIPLIFIGGPFVFPSPFLFRGRVRG